MQKASIKNIAKSLGISVATVSKALNNYPDVSNKTRKLVKELAEKLNYTPNASAVNLRTKESKTIGLIIPVIVHHFFSNVVKGVISEAEKKGYLVIILYSNESYELEKKQISLLLKQGVDAIILSMANETANYKHLREVIAQDIPLIMFDKIAKIVHCSKIIIDDRKAAYTATQHLIDTGCKKIAHFRGSLLPQNSIDRFLGYKQALLDNNLSFDPSLVYLCEELTFEEGQKYAKQLLEEHKDVDGLFVNTDLVSIGAIKQFKKHNIKIPEDISVVGFSNWFISSIISPTLTTIDQPGFLMGETAFNQAYKEIHAIKNKEQIEPEIITLDTALIKRETTK